MILWRQNVLTEKQRVAQGQIGVVKSCYIFFLAYAGNTDRKKKKRYHNKGRKCHLQWWKCINECTRGFVYRSSPSDASHLLFSLLRASGLHMKLRALWPDTVGYWACAEKKESDEKHVYTIRSSNGPEQRTFSRSILDEFFIRWCTSVIVRIS